jgi:[protein-PII] uridylyltransferase
MIKTAPKSASQPLPLKEQLAALRAGSKTPDLNKLKPSVLSISRVWLAAERQKIKEQFMASDDALAMLSAYSHVVDILLEALFTACLQGKSAPVALAAVGGYGREELFPYSDIDILFLYDEKGANEAAIVAEFVLYILWDLGLKVGQSHRSVSETINLAKSDVTIRTNLLDSRFLIGQQAIYKQFRQRFDKEIVANSALEFVEAKLSERDLRHMHYGDSRYMLEPNVKEGKGGLRDLHTLWWLARYCYPIQSRDELLKLKLLTPEEYQAFHNARDFLWRVRIHLHYLTERPEERLTFGHQQALAAAMGYKHPSVNRSIERFMRRYFAHVRTVGNITRVFCALLEEEKKRKPKRSLAWLWQAPWKLGHFKLVGQRLDVRTDLAFEMNPVLMIEMFRVAQIHGLDIHPHALQLVARHLDRIDHNLRADDAANGLFLDILLAYQGPETTLRRMSEAGVLGRLIPDFGRIIGRTQFNMYHVFTVDEHTLVALGILHAIEKGRLLEELPVVSSIINRIQMRNVLYLALFCHDLAKGRGGDHSELGEKIAAKLAIRLGFTPKETETAAWLVKQHLLFSNTAFKRDIDDPKTVQDFVAIVQSPERLKLLLALTVADIRAVGPGVWNGWKAALLRELYRRAEEAMGAGEVELKRHQAGQFREELLKLLPGWTPRDIDGYLEQGSPTYWMSFDLPRHAIVARMIKGINANTSPLLIDTQHDYERSITEIIVCTYDQHALFSKIAGAVALAGANIITAKIFTLKNGIAIDVFQVQDTAGQVFDRSDKLAKMSVYMEQALSGELDLAAAFAKRAKGRSGSRSVVPMTGQVFIENNASNIASVIEMTGQDRSGFLYDVTSSIAKLGLSIVTAHISTYGTQVADVFYVKDIFGMKITHETRIKEIRAKLLQAIGGKS